MIAIDTNVLVRILIDDPSAEKQCQLARHIVNYHKDIWVCHIVLVETIWVLQKVYSFKKPQVILVLKKLIQHPHLHLEDTEILEHALHIFNVSNADFADCLILSKAQQNDLALHTFDRKLAQIQGTKQITKAVESLPFS